MLDHRGRSAWSLKLILTFTDNISRSSLDALVVGEALPRMMGQASGVCCLPQACLVPPLPHPAEAGGPCRCAPPRTVTLCSGQCWPGRMTRLSLMVTTGERGQGELLDMVTGNKSRVCSTLICIADRLRQKSWSPSSVSCVAARKIVRRSVLGPVCNTA